VLAVIGVAALMLLGVMPFFVVAVALLVLWALASAIEEPIRRAFLNALIPSQQRATVLSFDSLIGSAGGVVIQPALGRVADLNGYAASYLVGGAVQALAIPFIFLARRERAHSDPIFVEP
jgi:MFS family permease